MMNLVLESPEGGKNLHQRYLKISQSNFPIPKHYLIFKNIITPDTNFVYLINKLDIPSSSKL